MGFAALQTAACHEPHSRESAAPTLHFLLNWQLSRGKSHARLFGRKAREPRLLHHPALKAAGGRTREMRREDSYSPPGAKAGRQPFNCQRLVKPKSSASCCRCDERGSPSSSHLRAPFCFSLIWLFLSGSCLAAHGRRLSVESVTLPPISRPEPEALRPRNRSPASPSTRRPSSRLHPLPEDLAGHKSAPSREERPARYLEEAPVGSFTEGQKSPLITFNASHSRRQEAR